jgi:hypothetical protein
MFRCAHRILRRVALGTALGIGCLVFDWPTQAQSNTSAPHAYYEGDVA